MRRAWCFVFAVANVMMAYMILFMLLVRAVRVAEVNGFVLYCINGRPSVRAWE